VLTALVSAALFAAAVALGLAVLYAVTVVPFLLTLSSADRGGLSTGRWAGISLLAVVVALGLALVLARAGVGPVLSLLPLTLAFVPAVAAHLLAGDDRWGGRAGRHESPL
jgi:hypothetical protein